MKVYQVNIEIRVMTASQEYIIDEKLSNKILFESTTRIMPLSINKSPPKCKFPQTYGHDRIRDYPRHSF